MADCHFKNPYRYLPASRPQKQQLRRVQFGGHIRQLELNGLLAEMGFPN